MNDERVCKTAQEYYDLLVATSQAGRFPSKATEGSQCFYRGPEGRACGVGIIIPDSRYDPEMDDMGMNATISNVFARYKLDDILPDDIAAWDLGDIQRAHDKNVSEASGRSEWSHCDFVSDLNSLHCFAGVNKCLPLVY